MTYTRSSLGNNEPFNPLSHQWTTLPTKMLGGGNRCFGSVFLNNEMFIVGGVGRSKTVTSYNCETGEWTQHPSLPEGRLRCAATAVNEHEFVVIGGNRPSESNFLYNMKTKTWSVLPPLQEHREDPACVSVGGKVYVIGGRHHDWCYDNLMEMLCAFQPSRAVWRA